jgi:predicted DNA-binding transcriptional regulator YafY
MAKRLAFERYLWFHARLKQKDYPKLKSLMDKFEISRRQASREIEFMRDFFGAPIEYSNEYNGYYYSNEGFDLPGIWTSEEEIVSLIISKRLSTTIPDQEIKKKIDTFFEKIYAHIDVDLTELEKKISLKNIRYYAVKPTIFEAAVYCLSNNYKCRIHYRSAYTQEQSDRVVSPLHLLLYMGNWHLIAYCDKKQGIRDFVLSRVMAVEVLEDRVDDNLADKDYGRLLENNYGIFFEGTPRQVRISFNQNIAGMVRDQIWFPGQSIEERPEGGLILSFPVVDFREVIRDVLRFGSDAEVLEPQELRGQIKEIISRMNSVYSQ